MNMQQEIQEYNENIFHESDYKNHIKAFRNILGGAEQMQSFY